MQSQITRPYGHDQAKEPIRIHHPEEEEHHEKGASKVLKKVKEKAKKIKNTLTKNGHSHEHDHDVHEEDDKYDEPDPEVHGSPVYESAAMRGGVTGQPESLSHAGETNIPAPEEIIPPGTNAFPVVSSDYTKPVEPEPEPEPLQDTLYGHEALSHPARTTDTSNKEERREAPIYHSLKVSEFTDRDESREAHHEPMIAESLVKMKVTDESPGQETGPGLEKDLPTRSSEFDRQSESGMEQDSLARFGGEPRSHSDYKNSPTYPGGSGTHDQFSPELSRPKERDDFEETRDKTTQETKPSTYTEKLAAATSPITDKVIAAKDAVASKLGYSGESRGGGQYESSVRDETPRSATGYGQKVAGSTVAEKLTTVYEKVKDTGSNVMTKLPLSGGGGVEETQQGEGKTVSARDYISGKLRPGEEEKALSEVIAEKLHLGGGGGGGGGEKKTTTAKEVEVTVEKRPTEKLLEEREHGEAVGEEGGGGMAGKIKGAVTSWLGGTKPKSPHSVEESSQSLGSTVGTTGFSDSGGSELTGKTGVGSGAVPVQRGLEN